MLNCENINENKFIVGFTKIGGKCYPKENDICRHYKKCINDIEDLFNSCDYTCKSELYKKMFSYSLVFMTFSFFDDFTVIEKIIDYTTIERILDIKPDSKSEEISMYYFSMIILNYLSYPIIKNGHLYVKCLKSAIRSKKKFNQIKS